MASRASTVCWVVLPLGLIIAYLAVNPAPLAALWGHASSFSSNAGVKPVQLHVSGSSSVGVEAPTLAATPSGCPLCPKPSPKKCPVCSCLTQPERQLGHEDAERLMPALQPMFFKALEQDKTREPWVIDIGSNIGECSTRMMQLFTPAACRKRFRDHPVKGAQPECERRGASVFSVEANPATFAALERLAQAEAWVQAGWRGIHAAVGKTDGGKASFYATEEGNRQSSLDSAAVGNTFDPALVVTVPIMSVDGFVARYKLEDRECLVLKIDVEGFDTDVVQGAKFVMFEYNAKWFARSAGASPSLSLLQVTQLLSKWGYACYYNTATSFIPLTGDWWVPAYEMQFWSNIFCGRKTDSDLGRFIHYWTTEDGLQIPVTPDPCDPVAPR